MVGEKKNKFGNLARGRHRCTEEALLFLALYFLWNESMKVLYYKWWKYLNYRLVIFIVKGNPGMLKLELTVSAQAGGKKKEREMIKFPVVNRKKNMLYTYIYKYTHHTHTYIICIYIHSGEIYLL